MYINKKNKNRFDIISFINGSDIYNSKLLKAYKDKELEFQETRQTYVLGKTDIRPDIIADKLLGSDKYESFIYMMNHDLDDENMPGFMKLDATDVSSFLTKIGV